jgi:hypothetical protein
MQWLLILAAVILIVVIFLYTMDNSDETFENVVGHEDTPKIRQAEKKLKKKKKPEALMRAADLNRFNIGDAAEADRLYAEALQLALWQDDPVAYNIADRINPTVPLLVGTPAAAVIRADPQNVHDSNVVQEMQKKYNIINRGQRATAAELKEFAATLEPQARAGYDLIMREPALIEHLGATDRDALQIIVARDPKLWPGLRDNLKNITQNGHPVCATGRMSQILDSLTLIDEEAGRPVLTTEILRKEMMDHCSKFILGLSEEDQQEYDEGDSDKIKEKLVADLKKNYAHLSNGPIFEKVLLEVEAAF